MNECEIVWKNMKNCFIHKKYITTRKGLKFRAFVIHRNMINYIVDIKKSFKINTIQLI